VDLYLDGMLHSSDNAQPYNYQLQNLGVGAHGLRAEAIDTDNLRTSASINVQVQTDAPPPPPPEPPTPTPGSGDLPPVYGGENGEEHSVGGCSMGLERPLAPCQLLLMLLALLGLRRRD
jgi:hypothetical protein